MQYISYRLGGFGFLASDELRIDNEKAGDKGVGNYGTSIRVSRMRPLGFVDKCKVPTISGSA